MRTTIFIFIVALAALLGACGEQSSSSGPPGDAPTNARTDAPTERTDPENGDGTEAEADALARQLEAQYEKRTPDAVLAEVRAAESKAPEPEPSQPDVAWTANVNKALAQAGIEARAQASAFEVAGGLVEAVEALGAKRADAWVRVERWRGGGDGVLPDRAALHVTPMEHADVRVEVVDLDGLRAFRSNLDDPEHPTFAWLHRGLFVRAGAIDQRQAAALHAALDSAGAYGADDEPAPPAPAKSSTAPAPKAREASGWPPYWSDPSEYEGDPILGRWIVRKTFFLMVHPTGVYEMWRRDEQKPFLIGTWIEDRPGIYHFTSGPEDKSPATGSIDADGTLVLADDGERLEAKRKKPRSTSTSTFGLPKESKGDSKSGDVPFEKPARESAKPDVAPTNAYAGGAFEARATGHADAANTRRVHHAAVEAALRWLAAHQSPDGRWEAAGFGRWCDGLRASGGAPDGPGKAVYDTGVTGLALCAFLGAGYTHRGRHPFAKTVGKGLRYLKSIQDADGCYGARKPPQFVYDHAAAALAMVEAYGMTGSPTYKGSAQRALDFIAEARNPYFAWRYGVQPGDNDTSVSGWMMMPLHSAQLVNRAAVARGKPVPLTVDKEAFDGLRSWLDKVTDPDYGSVGYLQRGTGPARPEELVRRFPGEKSESMTAVGMLARMYMGEDPRQSRLVKLGAHRCAKLPPSWNRSDGSIDMVYWYYGTQAMFQVGGKQWSAWEKSLQKAVLANQRKDTDACRFKGSWDPLGPWGPDGGRVYSTAMMALCLEVFYRYDRLFGER